LQQKTPETAFFLFYSHTSQSHNNS